MQRHCRTAKWPSAQGGVGRGKTSQRAVLSAAPEISCRQRPHGKAARCERAPRAHFADYSLLRPQAAPTIRPRVTGGGQYTPRSHSLCGIRHARLEAQQQLYSAFRVQMTL